MQSIRLFTCGSVDDGKSTLIGRMMYEANALYDDQLAQLRATTTPEGQPDFSILLDGLLAEAEQGITIDVAYRSFTTEKARFLIADTPGHEEYTRNMVTGASHADVALLLLDARKGLLPQTRRHMAIVSLLGVERVIVAINKMDCVGYDPRVFTSLEHGIYTYAEKLGLHHLTCVPVSALMGDNITEKSAATPWYGGAPLLELLENIKLETKGEVAFRMPVQWVARQKDYRGLAGTVLSGEVAVGQEVCLFPSGQKSRVKSIRTPQEKQSAKAGAEEAIMLELTDNVDAGRGFVLLDAQSSFTPTRVFKADVVVLDKKSPLVAGRSYILRHLTSQTNATVVETDSKLDLETLQNIPCHELLVNETGTVKIALETPLLMEPYATSKPMGAFLLIDRVTKATVAAGMMRFSLHRSSSVFWESFVIDKNARSLQKNQTPFVLWFTGLSGSGKSAVANALAQKLYAEGKHVYTLDGDNLRHGLNKDLGFTEHDRAENLRRAAEVSKILVDAGLIVLSTFISPYRMDRQSARDLFETAEFFEIYVDTPLEVCEQRDPKGLYARARAGAVPNFTGISAPFEVPNLPELVLHGAEYSVDELAGQLWEFLQAKGLV